VEWSLVGEHNVNNALAAIACARHVGVAPRYACEALATFKNVKRRLELRGAVATRYVYDDFAHHPTAIQTTLAGLRQRVGHTRIVAILEPRSNSMRMGIYQHSLADALREADEVLLFEPPKLSWSLQTVAEQLSHAHLFQQTSELIDYIVDSAPADTHILIMSNGDFENLHQRLLQALEAQYG
jgi:UDP-N-acetylmuramate: L-alanyl-gamma-D-glutamyl-meso-diaminopimelate ligase